MSEENVGLIRQQIDAYNRRDFDGLRTVFDADAELDWSASRGFEAGVYRGIDAILQWFTGYWAMFEEVIVEPVNFIEAGHSVVVPNVARLRGREGIKTSARSAFVYTIRNCKITRLAVYQETEQALKAVGLAE